MTTIAGVLYEFWSSFGIPAYPESGVPDHAQLPYITYEISMPVWDEPTTITARVWYRDSSYVGITGKVNEIYQRISDGLSIPTEDGSVVLFPEGDGNFAQLQPYEADNDLKIAYLILIMHAHTT